MRGPRAIVGALAALVGLLLLSIHLQHHPVPVSQHDLRVDPPRPGEVVLTTDNAIVVDEREDGALVVLIDQFDDAAILVVPPFEPGPPYKLGRVYVFDAWWPEAPAWETRTYRIHDGEANVTTLTNVVWEADRAQRMPAPWLPGAGVVLLALALVALAPAYAWAGAAAALGFAASHVAGGSALLVPELLVWGGGWLALLAGALIAALAAASPTWRARLPTAATLAAFGLAAWAERAMLAGYRPYTGIF